MSILREIESKTTQLAIIARGLELQRARIRQLKNSEIELAHTQKAVERELNELLDQLIASKM